MLKVIYPHKILTYGQLTFFFSVHTKEKVFFLLKKKFEIVRWSRKAWLKITTLVILIPLSLPPKKRGKKKRRMITKNRDFKSCLSGSSLKTYSKPRVLLNLGFICFCDSSFSLKPKRQTICVYCLMNNSIMYKDYKQPTIWTYNKNTVREWISKKPRYRDTSHLKICVYW